MLCKHRQTKQTVAQDREWKQSSITRGVGEEGAVASPLLKAGGPSPSSFFTSLCALYGCMVTILQLSEFCNITIGEL